MIFPEGLRTLDEYRHLVSLLGRIPVLANMTEFADSPLFDRQELAETGVSLILYPLSAFRAQSAAAETVYKDILETGSQAMLS